MAEHSIPPVDATAAAVAIVWGVAKWVALAVGGAIVTLFTALFAWVFKTDRAVTAMATAEEQDRAAREQWRAELMDWLKRIESRVTAGEINAAEQRGRNDARNERNQR